MSRSDVSYGRRTVVRGIAASLLGVGLAGCEFPGGEDGGDEGDDEEGGDDG